MDAAYDTAIQIEEVPDLGGGSSALLVTIGRRDATCDEYKDTDVSGMIPYMHRRTLDISTRVVGYLSMISSKFTSRWTSCVGELDACCTRVVGDDGHDGDGVA